MDRGKTKTTSSNTEIVTDDRVLSAARFELTDIDDDPKPQSPSAMRIIVEEANEDGFWVAIAERGSEKFGFGTGSGPHGAIDALITGARHAARLENGRNSAPIESVARLSRTRLS